MLFVLHCTDRAARQRHMRADPFFSAGLFQREIAATRARAEPLRHAP